MVNYKRKQYLEDINKKDMIIKKYEKKLNENQNEIRNLEKKLSFYKNKINSIFSIKNEIQINLINKDEKKDYKIILRSNPKLLTVENSINICYYKRINLGNKDNIKEYINNANYDKKKKENIFEVVRIENFAYNSKYKLREKEWIYHNNIIKEKGLNLNLDNSYNKIKKKENNNKIIKKESNIYFNIISSNNKKNISNLIKQEKNYNIYFEGINHKSHGEIKLLIENLNNIFIKQGKTEFNLFDKEKRKIEYIKNKNLIIECTSKIKYKGIKKDNNKFNLIEKNNELFLEGSKKEIIKINNNYIFERVNEYNIVNIKSINSKSCKLIIDSLLHIRYEGKDDLEIKNNYINKFKNLTYVKNFNLRYVKTIINKNIKLGKNKTQYLYIEGLKKCPIVKNYELEKKINLSFEGIRKEKQKLYSEKVYNIFYQKIKIYNKNKNELKIEQINSLYYENIKKDKNINIEKNINIYFEKINQEKHKLFEIMKNNDIFINDLNKKNIKYSIEKISNVIYEKIIKNKIFYLETKKEIFFSIISKQKNKSKKFENIEISKDIISNIFIENLKKGISLKKEKIDIDNSLYEEILETPKKEISKKSINRKINSNISTSISSNVSYSISSINAFNMKTEKKDNNNINNDKFNKKIERASRAMNRIKHRNQTQIENNNKIAPEIFNTLESLENKNTKGEVKYRQSLRIMEIAKYLERETTKQDINVNKEKEIGKNDNNIKTKYINSNIVDIISLKPIDNKKKKKNRISFNG